MKIFKHLGPGRCLVCQTNEDKPCALLGIIGSEEEDGNMQAVQVHIDCLDLQYYPQSRIIGQKVVVLNEN